MSSKQNTLEENVNGGIRPPPNPLQIHNRCLERYIFHKTLTFANNNFDKPMKLLRIEGFSLDSGCLISIFAQPRLIDSLKEFMKYIINTLMSI